MDAAPTEDVNRWGDSLTLSNPLAYVECALRQSPAHSSMMFMQPNSSYRDYYYYGSLSTRRDGAAKDCQKVLSR